MIDAGQRGLVVSGKGYRAESTDNATYNEAARLIMGLGGRHAVECATNHMINREVGRSTRW